ncbi:MAG: protein kinase, partial [Planctomycetales bacterium]
MKDVVLADYLLPDRDNTAFAYTYREDGEIEVNNALSEPQAALAKSALELVGLDKPISEVEDENGPEANQAATQIAPRLEKTWGKASKTTALPNATIKRDGPTTRMRAEPDAPTAKVQRRSLVKASDEPSGEADYQLLTELGAGGMGVVYEAGHLSLTRSVAVKMLHPRAAQDETERSKFVTEAQLTGKLDHPNIVPIHELGVSDEGALFYSMKRVRRHAWSEVLPTKTRAENLEILLRVADATAFAHSLDVIHRDLKPDNVMLGDYGEVLLMDWGLAARMKDVAPEMALHVPDHIGPRSDVYLLGAILYEIVAGFPPHDGDSVMDCVYKAATNEIEPTDKDDELTRVALRAMETDVEQRHASVKDFQRAIRDYQDHSESIQIGELAELDLKTARQTNNYDVYARSVFGFRQALEWWPDNDAATSGLRDSMRAYAQCAFDKGDFDLAASLIEQQGSDQGELAQRIQTARRLRDLQRFRLRAAWVSTGLLLVIVAVGSLLAYLEVRGAYAVARTNERKAKQAAKQEAEQRRKAEDAAKQEAEQRRK